MVPAIFAKIGIPVLVSVLSEALGKIDHPAAQGASRALDEVDEALQGGQIKPGQLEEANRHAEKMAELELQEYEGALAQINQSLRAEVASEDKYVRRMRPTFGYLMALTWAAQMFGVAYIIVFRTAEAGAVLQAIQSLSMIWTVGLSVLGIYVYKRSDEKKL
jgi:hypothetical protein